MQIHKYRNISNQTFTIFSYPYYGMACPCSGAIPKSSFRILILVLFRHDGIGTCFPDFEPKGEEKPPNIMRVTSVTNELFFSLFYHSGCEFLIILPLLLSSKHQLYNCFAASFCSIFLPALRFLQVHWYAP